MPTATTWRIAWGTTASSSLMKSASPAPMATRPMASPPAMSTAAMWTSGVSPATRATSPAVADKSNAIGKWTTAGWSGWPSIGGTLNQFEHASAEEQEADNGQPGVGKDHALGWQLFAGVEGGEIKSAERGDDEDQQRNRDDASDSVRFGAEHDERGQHQAGGAERGVEQRQGPGRELSAQNSHGHDQPAERADRENQDRNFQHCFLLFIDRLWDRRDSFVNFYHYKVAKVAISVRFESDERHDRQRTGAQPRPDPRFPPAL